MWLYVLYLFHTGNTVLFVAHASSLEACTRQIQGLNPQNSKDFVQVVRKVSVAFQFRRFFDFLCNFSLSQCFFWTTCISVSSFVQIPYLGFCSCEEMGETGVWQLVDPPILPLTHGPNHSFNWREMLMQDWRICSLALLSWTAEQKVASIKRHHAKNKKKKQKRRQMYSNTLLRNGNVQFVWRLQKNVLQFGRDFAALSSAIYLLTQNVEVLRGMQMAVWFVDGCRWIRFYVTRGCLIKLCLRAPLWQRGEWVTTLCSAAFSHTVTRISWERVVYQRNYIAVGQK